MKWILQIATAFSAAAIASATQPDDGGPVRLRCHTNGAAFCVLQRDVHGALQMLFSNAGRDVVRMTYAADVDVPTTSRSVATRNYSSARFDFVECSPGVASTLGSPEVIAVKDAGVFIFFDRGAIGPVKRPPRHRWFPIESDGGEPEVDVTAQAIHPCGKGAGFLARYFCARLSFDPAVENDRACIEVRQTGGDASAVMMLVIPDACIVRELERYAASGSTGFALTLTNDMRVLCLASEGDKSPPVVVRQLGISSRLAVMAGMPNQPVHGLLMGAEILPADTNSPPVWSSIRRLASGEAMRAASVTLPRDCEFCLSESFEVIAPLPGPSSSSER